MSDKTCEQLYGWSRCTHEDIGLPGCPTCDPNKNRVMIRCLWLDKRDLKARLAEVEADAAALREALLLQVEASGDVAHLDDECDYDTEGGQRDCPRCVRGRYARAALSLLAPKEAK
jgi:hypothetical protein